MRLAAVFHVWGDQDLLKHSVKNIRPLVDGVIIIYSDYSNFGEREDFDTKDYGNCFKFTPVLSSTPMANETAKRNYGLEKARDLHYTHFLMLDADEFYLREEFEREKVRFVGKDLAGLVCRTKVYFRSPTLTIGYDTTLVPFIHKITPNLKFEFNKNYPFAWTDTDAVPFTPNRRIRIDPTRSLNISSGVEWSDITMHHYSYVRTDVKKKIRNSTARQNIENSSLVEDYVNAKEGYFCKFYGKKLLLEENIFNLPELVDESLSPN